MDAVNAVLENGCIACIAPRNQAQQWEIQYRWRFIAGKVNQKNAGFSAAIFDDEGMPPSYGIIFHWNNDDISQLDQG